MINQKKIVKELLPEYSIVEYSGRRYIYLPYRSKKAIIYSEILEVIGWTFVTGEARYNDLLCIEYAEPRDRR